MERYKHNWNDFFGLDTVFFKSHKNVNSFDLLQIVWVRYFALQQDGMLIHIGNFICSHITVYVLQNTL